jgi:hypothetical protein
MKKRFGTWVGETKHEKDQMRRLPFKLRTLVLEDPELRARIEAGEDVVAWWKNGGKQEAGARKQEKMKANREAMKAAGGWQARVAEQAAQAAQEAIAASNAERIVARGDGAEWDGKRLVLTRPAAEVVDAYQTNTDYMGFQGRHGWGAMGAQGKTRKRDEYRTLRRKDRVTIPGDAIMTASAGKRLRRKWVRVTLADGRTYEWTAEDNEAMADALAHA